MLSVLQSICWPLSALEFYQKPIIQQRIERREMVSVVEVRRPPESQAGGELLELKAVGLVNGLSVSDAMSLMTDYERLEKIAPQYIKASSLKQADGTTQKYLHVKAQVKSMMTHYNVEALVNIQEEMTPDRAVIHCEVIPAESMGYRIENEKFIGFKSDVVIQQYKRYQARQLMPDRGAHHRLRDSNAQLSVLFKGSMDRQDVSTVVPNFVLKFAMELALQRVGILLRNYLEAAKSN